jgi:hypothetical protein
LQVPAGSRVETASLMRAATTIAFTLAIVATPVRAQQSDATFDRVHLEAVLRQLQARQLQARQEMVRQAQAQAMATMTAPKVGIIVRRR